MRQIPPKLKAYVGSKGGAGVYQNIINHIPKHDRMHVLFLGSGQICSRLRGNYVIASENDRKTLDEWYKNNCPEWLFLINADYSANLESTI